MSKLELTWIRICACAVLLALSSCQSRRLQHISTDPGNPGQSASDVGVSTLAATSGEGGDSVKPGSPGSATSTEASLPPDSATGSAAGVKEGSADTGEELVFVTEGSQFSPVVVLRGQARVRWHWADGTASDSTKPVKDYGSRAQRRNRLRVEPWSAVQRINIGFDASDGGDPRIERVPNQEVSSVAGLQLLAPYLEQWCSSFNPITRLDFSHFRNLETIESFKMARLAEVRLNDTPRLKRACFEETGLKSLDVSESPSLMDLRGALSRIGEVRFGQAGPQLWHVCIRDNPQMNSPKLFSDGAKFPQIAELFIWKTNQRGTLSIHSTHPERPIEIWAGQNNYEAADFTGALRGRSPAMVDVSFNALSKLLIGGCVQLKTLKAGHNRLDTAAVDGILQEIDSWKTEAGSIDLVGNAPPSSRGTVHKRSLESRRWKVAVDAS